MSPKRPDPDWGQSIRRLGPAGGKHTRGNQGKKPGCLDSIVIFGGSLAGLTYGLEKLLG